MVARKDRACQPESGEAPALSARAARVLVESETLTENRFPLFAMMF
jgi:hypothetical protein